MDFGLLFEIGVPKPWDDRSEHRAYWNALEQARTADREAAIKLGMADEAVRQRREAVTAIGQLRREPPRRILPERPATAATADELAAELEATCTGRILGC